MKILKRIAVWILAFVMFFIPSAPLGVSAAETADKIQVDHDTANDIYFVHDTNIILFCMNNGLAWPSKELGLPTEANYSPMDFKDFLIANGITDSEKINAMTSQLETILYAGYPYNGANLYSNADKVDAITVEEYNEFLVPPSVIREDFPDEIGNEVFTYSDIMSKNEKYEKLQNFVKKVFDMGNDSTTKSGLTRIQIQSLPFYQAIIATNFGDPLQVLPAIMGDSYYLTKQQAYEATSNAVWSLMAENGVPDNSPVEKKPLTYSLLGLKGANILKSEPSSSAVSITGDGEFKFDTTDKKWKTGTLTLNAPSNYYAKYAFQLPDGVTTTNGRTFVSAGESFQLVSDNEPADNLSFSVSADVAWMEGDLKVYHPPEGLLSTKLDTSGNPEGFQNMVGAVINKANVGASMTLSKESTEVSFTVTKNWDDDNNRDGLRPNASDYASKVHLMNGNTEVTGVTPVITDNNDNTYTISYSNLNKYINGENTDYKLKEDSITGYTPSAETVKNGETLVNTHTPETVDISITKNWVDGNNQDGIRPTATEYTGMVHLMKGDNADNEVVGVVPAVTDNGNGTFTVKYTGLPKKENGTDIQYSVKEDIVDGYKADTYTVKNGETITNTHSVGTTYISITKAWSDGNNQDGKRPSASQFASMVKLYRDNDVEVNGVTPVVEDNLDGTYKISYENLPKNSNGQPIEYSIKEENVDGYTADKTVVKDGETLTNTHTPETFTLIVTKSWNDDGNRDGLRPGTDLFAGKLSLMKDNTVVEGATPVIRDNGDNTYTIEYANLQKYENGTEINYSVKEDGVDGYTADKTAAKNGETITNTHTPEVIDITVTKNWVDDNNRDGIRPGANDFASKLHLMNGETEVTGVVPSVVDNNDGTYTVKYTNLAKNAAGTPITYSVKEDAVSGYTTDNNTALNGGVITNTHTPERTNVVVTKKWDDNNNQDRVRPDTTAFAKELHLKAGESEITDVTPEVTIGADNTYVITYSNLLKNENGAAITYTVSEGAIAGYATDNNSAVNGGTITNVHTPDTTEITITKRWEDGNNQDGIRPDADAFKAKLHLLGDGAEVNGATAEVIDNNDGTYTVKYANLQKNKDGNAIEYTISEDGVDGYTADKTAAKNGETITNTHTPEVIDITVTKNWVDDNNRDRIRPVANDFASKLHLMNGETEVTGVVPSVVDNNDGTYTVKYTNLAKNAAGTPITYSVKEDTVSGYTTDNNTALNGGVITNTHTPERTNVVVTKKWDDNNDQDRVRPDTTAFAKELHLKAGEREITDVTPEVTIGADNTYVITYSNLLKNENGAAITYTVSEGAIAGYATDNNSAVNGGTITNVHTPDTTEITITKRWEDGNNQDGIRPDADAFKAKLHLLGDGAEVNGVTAEVIDNDDGTYTVKYANLQKNKDGNAIEYTISEDSVDGYTADKTAAKNGETITNTHTPEVIDITVTKNWIDDNNRDGIRPGANDFASKLHLMNGETEVTGVVPSVVDNNDGTYTVKYTNLAKNAAGTPITYSVKEDAVSGYTTDNNTALNGGVITNTHTPERTNVVVTKKWDDNNDQDRVRPGADEFASKLHLLADGTEVDGVTAEVVDNNDGTYTVTYSDVLKYENGNIIVYGITEDDIAGYSSSQDVVYEGEVLVNVHKVKENNGENGGNKDNTDNNSNNNLNNKSDKKVDTADHSNNMIYYVLIAISATGIISAAAVAGRKKH